MVPKAAFRSCSSLAALTTSPTSARCFRHLRGKQPLHFVCNKKVIIHITPLVVPKAAFRSCSSLAALTTSPTSARCFRHRRRSQKLPGTRTSALMATKKQALFFSTCVFPWQGQKDLNPRHAVLETAALPSELYPYEVIGVWWANRDSNPGPTGYEPVALTN